MRKSEFEKQKTNTYNSADHESVAQNGEKMRKKANRKRIYFLFAFFGKNIKSRTGLLEKNRV